MTLPTRMKFGIFMAPFHWPGENPTLAIERDLELVQWLDYLGFDEAWIGEHHSAGWETIASPEIFIATAAERTKHIKLGTGVISLPYHNPLMVANRMILLDHLTRGRVMMGVGPGALISDAYMLGIDPTTQRARMDESLGIILRLMKGTEPVSYESEWFTLKEALVQVRPYTVPHMPIAVAASQSPAGMVLAGKHGAAVLSLNAPPGGGPPLSEFWSIAEETAHEYGHTMKRDEWRLVLPVHLAHTKKEALDQARLGAGRYWRDYIENTLGFLSESKIPAAEIIDYMSDNNQWCVGTPDDLINAIMSLDEATGGFGGILIQVVDWAPREHILQSYELVARYVMPRFQASLTNLETSQTWSSQKKDKLLALRNRVVDKARDDYEIHKKSLNKPVDNPL